MNSRCHVPHDIKVSDLIFHNYDLTVKLYTRFRAKERMTTQKGTHHGVQLDAAATFFVTRSLLLPSVAKELLYIPSSVVSDW